MAKKNDPIENSIYSPFRNNPRMSKTRLMENMYRRNLVEWASTRFKWNNLPDTIDPRFMEQTLFYRGYLLFYFDVDLDRFLCVRGTHRGQMNMYDNPTKFRTLDMPGYRGKELMPSECVPIWGNYSRIPAVDILYIYAAKLAELDVTLDQVQKGMRISRVVLAEESQRQTYTNLMRQHDDGTAVIFGTPGLNLEQVQTLDLEVNPLTLEALRMEKNQVWNEAMTLLGITNTNQDKKERLVAAEATGNDGQVLASRNMVMKPRLEACEQINRIFGDRLEGEVSVEWDLDESIVPTVGENPNPKLSEDEADFAEEPEVE